MRLNPKLLVGLLLVGMITLSFSPLLDQRLAIIPYDNVKQLFYGETSWWCRLIYLSVNAATGLLILGPLVLLLRSRKAASAQRARVKRMFLISYLSLAIGPCLVVNTIFKDYWGRARPYQVIRDHHPFSLPWQPHFDRPKDNSFPSGHVSIGAFIGIPFIAYRRRRLGITLCALGFSVVGVVRYLQGGHYFSDIVMAGILVWLLNLLVTYLVDGYLLKRRVSDES